MTPRSRPSCHLVPQGHQSRLDWPDRERAQQKEMTSRQNHYQRMIQNSRIMYVVFRRQLSQVHTNGVKQLGDCLGKGAFGSVYRALNWNTGETVAVKQIKLADLPKSELRVIMVRIQSTVRVISKLAADEPLQLEIDLLKALDVSSGSDDVCGLLIN